MHLYQKINSLLQNPREAQLYLRYLYSRLRNKGDAIRSIKYSTKYITEAISITGFQNFTEYNTCTRAINKQDLAAYSYTFDQMYSIEVPIIFDIGANLGVVSSFIKKKLPSAQLYSFEPNPDLYQSLQKTLKLNGCNNSRVVNKAISDVNGHLPFDFRSDCRAAARIVQEESEIQYTKSVESVTLDDYCANEQIPQIDLLKVDVEGYEAKVFEGAKQLLSQKRISYIYFEYCSLLEKHANIKEGLALDILKDNGYRFYTCTSARNMKEVIPEDIQKVKIANWLAIA